MGESKRVYWVYWLIMTIGIAGYLVIKLTGDDKRVFLPGQTTHGHYQIEMACATCHSEPLGGGEVLQDACMNCHGEELKIADDSHPKSKFTNPRNADRVEKLDARKCITCHTEHKQEITGAMGVTLPDDFCFKCHQDVAENRPSHEGLAFPTCATGGCHNFHDNRALYEDFLAKHLDEPAQLETVRLQPLSLSAAYRVLADYPIEQYPIESLAVSDADKPMSVRKDSKIMQDWMDTAHSQSGVNCSACHMQQLEQTIKPEWIDKPSYEVCMTCHNEQAEGFLAGKHGMRLAQGLNPMQPSMARSEMKVTAHNKELTCISCHSAHRFDTRHAAVEACLSCHDDQHSRAYKSSSHFDLWHKEITGSAGKDTGVSCATCHLPRKQIKHEGSLLVIAEHNQNNNLRPNEKMLRSVCMQCHGFGFSIDSLADRDLIENNFSEKPGVHIESLDMVKQRLDLKKDVEGM